MSHDREIPHIWTVIKFHCERVQ